MSANRREFVDVSKYLNDGKETHVLVVPREGEFPERAIRKFIRKSKKAGIVDQVMKNEYYEKPSEIRKRKDRRRKKMIERSKISSNKRE